MDFFKSYVTLWSGNFVSMVITLIISGFIGAFLGYFLHEVIKKGIRVVVRKLDNAVLIFSLIVAIVCVIAAICLGYNEISIQLLSFYASFIFAWLLTKKNAKEEFIETQHRVAKNTYRHIEDVETATIVTRDRLQEYKEELHNNPEFKVDLDGLIDNVDMILTGIRSNKKDWEDMLKKSYRNKIKEQEDPEAKLANMRKPKREVKAPEKEELKNTFCTETEEDVV